MSNHTPGPWRAEKTFGWGGDICIVADGHVKPIFKAVKPDSYYTDFPPGREPGSVVISSRLAAAQGRYVATPEVRADIDAVEEANARLIAAAPELLSELMAAERIILVMLKNMTPEQRRAADETLTREEVSPDGMTRYYERRAVIEKATGA